MWKVYLDACCLSRPFDDQTQDRIRLEAEAILLIMTHLQAKKWEWVSSDVLDFETDRIPDPEQCSRIKWLSNFAHHSVKVGQAEEERAKHLVHVGVNN